MFYYMFAFSAKKKKKKAYAYIFWLLPYRFREDPFSYLRGYLPGL